MPTDSPRLCRRTARKPRSLQLRDSRVSNPSLGPWQSAAAPVPHKSLIAPKFPQSSRCAAKRSPTDRAARDSLLTTHGRLIIAIFKKNQQDLKKPAGFFPPWSSVPSMAPSQPKTRALTLAQHPPRCCVRSSTKETSRGCPHDSSSSSSPASLFQPSFNPCTTRQEVTNPNRESAQDS